MARENTFNFSAGPSVMPESVLKATQRELLDYKGTGMSVMEMSHRSPAFQEIFDNTKSALKRLMNVPDTHEILFLQGGATTQFAAIPMNLIEGGTADYAVTGNFSGKAAKEAEKYGQVNIAASTAGYGHDRIPTQAELNFTEGAKYFYYCANNTIYGTEWHYVPECSSPIVCDMSSDILSAPVDVSKFGLIYAGAQKNIGPAGVTLVIVRRDLLGRARKICPKIMDWTIMAEKGSMLNTPPTYAIYMCGLCLKWLKKQGGVAAIEKVNIEKANLLYDLLDESAFYRPTAEAASRSRMNVTFTTPDADTDALFVKEAAQRGLANLKGHRLVGGIRASIYNAMPMEGVRALAQFMKDFEMEHR